MRWHARLTAIPALSFASRLIRQREIVRVKVSHTRRHGDLLPESATTSRHHVTEDAVMASEIEQLPDLAGFFKLALRSVAAGYATAAELSR